MSIQISFKPFHHRGAEQLAICFPHSKEIDRAVRSVAGIRWTQTHKCWYLPLSRVSFQAALEKLKSFGAIEYSELKEYLDKRKLAVTVSAATIRRNPRANRKTTATDLYYINKPNLDLLERTVNTLKIKAYATNTIDLYAGELLQLMRLLRERSLDTLSSDEIKSYLLWLLETKKCSESKVHSTLNALKFCFEQVLYRSKIFIEIPRPKKPFQLPE